MAATLDSHMSQQDDLSHDTLMGLQELDSHLAIFESSNPGRESSTPGASSIFTVGECINASEHSSHTIIVDSPMENYSRPYQSIYGPVPQAQDKMFGSISQYVYSLYVVLLN